MAIEAVEATFDPVGIAAVVEAMGASGWSRSEVAARTLVAAYFDAVRRAPIDLRGDATADGCATSAR